MSRQEWVKSDDVALKEEEMDKKGVEVKMDVREDAMIGKGVDDMNVKGAAMNKKEWNDLDHQVMSLAGEYFKAGEEERLTMKPGLETALRQLYEYTANCELTEHDPDIEPAADWLTELDADSCIKEDEGSTAYACQCAAYDKVQDYLDKIHFSEEQICCGEKWYRVDDFTDEEIAEIIGTEIRKSVNRNYKAAMEEAGDCENQGKCLKRFCSALIGRTGKGLTLEHCDVNPGLTSQYEYDDDGLQKYWVGEDYNRWNAARFSREEAKKAEDTLYRCMYCDDCVDCFECKYCHQCSDCRNCNYCENSVKCNTCDYCSDCQDCDYCEYSEGFVHSEHCKYGENCEDCSYCVHCYDCRNCSYCEHLNHGEGIKYNQK